MRPRTWRAPWHPFILVFSEPSSMPDMADSSISKQKCCGRSGGFLPSRLGSACPRLRRLALPVSIDCSRRPGPAWQKLMPWTNSTKQMGRLQTLQHIFPPSAIISLSPPGDLSPGSSAMTCSLLVRPLWAPGGCFRRHSYKARWLHPPPHPASVSGTGK